MKITEKPVVVEQSFKVSKEKVWNAITDIQEMPKWFFENIEDFKPEVGFNTEFEVFSGERKFTHQWQITEVIPFETITYNWKYKEYSGNSFVTFKLIEEKGFTTLKLTATVTKDFPDDIPEFSRESCLGGWTYFIKGNLTDYLTEKYQL